MSETPEPQPIDPETQAAINGLITARPYILDALRRGLPVEAALDLIGESLLFALTTREIALPEGSLQKALSLSGKYLDVISEAEWDGLKTDGAGWDFIEAWADWSHGEAFRIFSRDYVVGELSGLTMGRWEAFLDEWLSVTQEARRQVFDEYLVEVEGMEPEWALALSTGTWNGDVEVEYVEPKVYVSSEDLAVPRDASGKEISV